MFTTQNIQPLLHEIVFGDVDAVDNDGEIIYQQLDQSKFTPYLWAICQKQQIFIEALEEKVQVLENAT
jgi:hypothetical protein